MTNLADAILARVNRISLNPPWTWLGLGLAVLARTFNWVWYRWTLGIYQSAHALLMPPVVGDLIWEKLIDDPPAEVESSPWAFLFLVPCLALIALDSAIGAQLLSAIAFVGLLPGISLLLPGQSYTRLLAYVGNRNADPPVRNPRLRRRRGSRAPTRFHSRCGRLQRLLRALGRDDHGGHPGQLIAFMDRGPMTLFMVEGRPPTHQFAQAEQLAYEWLGTRWEAYSRVYAAERATGGATG